MTAPDRQNPQHGTGQQPLQWATLRQCPVVLVWLGLALLLLPVSLQLVGALRPLLDQLWMVDPAHWRLTPVNALWTGLEAGQWWRLIAPVFLHFSLMHIAFNAVLFLVLGTRLELRLGSVALLLILVVWAIASNLAQLLASEHAAFGGLSGVVAAMFGALVVLGYLRPQDPLYQLPRGFVPAMLISLIVFTSGVTELFGIKIANAAHWAGVGGGLIAGGILHLLLSSPTQSRPEQELP